MPGQFEFLQRGIDWSAQFKALGLSNRTCNALKNAMDCVRRGDEPYNDVEQLMQQADDVLLRIPGFGRGGLAEVRAIRPKEQRSKSEERMPGFDEHKGRFMALGLSKRVAGALAAELCSNRRSYVKTGKVQDMIMLGGPMVVCVPNDGRLTILEMQMPVRDA